MLFCVCVFAFCLLVWLGCQYQCKWLTGKTRFRNDLWCVVGDDKPFSLTHTHKHNQWAYPATILTDFDLPCCSHFQAGQSLCHALKAYVGGTFHNIRLWTQSVVDCSVAYFLLHLTAYLFLIVLCWHLCCTYVLSCVTGALQIHDNDDNDNDDFDIVYSLLLTKFKSSLIH